MPLPRAAPIYDKTGAPTLFSAPPPAGGEDRGAPLSAAQAESMEEGRRTQRLEVAPAAPLTFPSPPAGGEGDKNAHRAGMTAARPSGSNLCNYILQESVGSTTFLCAADPRSSRQAPPLRGHRPRCAFHRRTEVRVGDSACQARPSAASRRQCLYGAFPDHE